jgi:guanylate kinase
VEKAGKQLYPLFVVSGPAAAGKSKVAEHVLADFPQISRVVTCTTRKRRAGEKDGVDYHFLTKTQFIKALEENEFIEHADVHGKLYGVRVRDIREAHAKGPVIIILDPQGTEKITELFNDAHCIFIMAPDDDLRMRLTARSTSDSDFARRMEDAEKELRQVNRWYYGCIINNANGYLERSLKQLYSFIKENLD